MHLRPVMFVSMLTEVVIFIAMNIIPFLSLFCENETYISNKNYI